VEDVLVGQGCDPDLAWIILEYLPAAMAEPVVERMGATRIPTYVRRLTDGTQVTCNWEDDVVYRAICIFRDSETYERWDEFKKIAQCSADLDAINNALKAGQDVEGNLCSIAPFHELPPSSPWLPQNKTSCPPMARQLVLPEAGEEHSWLPFSSLVAY